MADFEVGSAYVSLMPSARGFSKKAQAELAKVDLEKSVDLDADAAKLEAAVKHAKQQLDSLNREKVTPSISFDVSVAEARIEEIKAKLDELRSATPSPKVNVQIAEAERDLNKVTGQLDKLNQQRASVNVDADITAASAHLSEVQAKLDEVNRLRAQPKVDADTTVAKQRLSELDSRLRELSSKKASPEVELQIAQAQQQALRIRAELDRLGSMRPTAQVDADVALASAQLARINQQLSAIDGKRVNANVSASGNASLILAGIVAALGAVAAAAPAAIAALAAVGGAAGALGQGVAAGLAGFTGIGDALKALEADEKSAATSSASSSNTRSNAAKQVASAQSALGQAQTQADRAAITGAQQVASAQQSLGQARLQQSRTAVQGAQQVADAERALGQAVQQAARARITADQQVAAARRAVSDAITSANQRVASAERSLESTQRGRQSAQEALTRAVEDATRANRDLQLSVSGAALSEERATLSLAQARDRLAKSTSSDPLERADLSLAVREAEQNLREVQTRYGDLRQEQSQWAATGVMGSRQVVDATRGVADAQRSVQDAQRGLVEAQLSGARQVSDAQESLARAQQSAAWSVADAQQSVVRAQEAVQRASVSAAEANADAAAQVAQAQLGVSQAVQQASWSQQDAARQVVDAQRALAEAYTSGGESAAAGAKQAEYALSKLTPAGRSLVTFLKNEFQPAWKRVTDSVANEMLPKVETALRNSLKLEPTITAGLTEAGRVLGDLAVRGSELATSPPFMASFSSIMASNNRALSDYGSAGINLFGAFTDLYAVAGPVAERFSRLADYSADAFESWVIGARQTGELDRYLQSAGDTLQYVGGWIVDVSGDVIQFTMAFAPLGVVLLEGVRSATDFIAAVASWNPVLTSVVGGLGLAAIAASKLGTATAGLSVAGAAGGIGGLASSVRTLLIPSLLAATGPMTALGASGAAAGGKLGEMAGKVTGSTTAIANGAAAGAKFTQGLAKMGSALPLVGVAIAGAAAGMDAMGTSTDEATSALAKGGQAAADMRAQLAATDAKTGETGVTIGNFGNYLTGSVLKLLGFESSTKSATEALEQQRSKMTELERAQSIAAEAQGNYELALRNFGAASPQAQLALQNLSAATRDVEIKQLAARTATDLATASMLYQAQQTLGTLNADLAKQQSLLQIEQAQKTYNDAVRANGPSSLEARTAYVQYEQSLLAGIASVQAAAQKQFELEGRTDAAAQAQREADLAALNMANTIRGNIPDALAKYIGSMDAGRLSAIGARVETDEFGNSVIRLPNGKAVPISAPGAVQAKDEVIALRREIERLQNMGMVTIPMQVAGGVPTGPDLRNPTGNGQVPIFIPGRAQGGPIGYPTGGKVRGAGTSTSDSIPAMLSNGEYVVRAAAVKHVGVGALDTINAQGYARGGRVGYAAGGAAKPQPAAAASSEPAAAAVTVPTGDPAATGAAASATSALASSMGSAATQAQTLNPALAALATTQATMLAPATAAVTAGQQALVTGGILPLVGTMLSSLFPTLGIYQQQVGVAAPAANTALQTSQLATQAQTTATALNTAVNSGLMNAAVTGMSLTGQAQHAALRGSQMLTQASNAQTATSTAINSQNMAISTTSMSTIGQQQHGNLRLSQGLTQASNNATAINTAQNNANMIATTGNMSATNQGHLGFLRGGLDTTKMSVQGTADWWQGQMGRMVPDSANPIRWILQFPMRSIVDAWNNLDRQFALGKPVTPVLPGFATGGQISGPGSGTSDSIMARLSDGEFVVRESVASRVPHFLNALNSGQPEAIQAAGGRGANPYPGFAAGGVIAAQEFAKSQNGKPYQWGGTGNPSWDCCIIGPVRVYGPNGATPIKDVRAGDEVWSYVDGKLTAQTVTAAWQSETQPVFKVRTRNRSVIASANHPFMRLVASDEQFVETADEEWAGLPPKNDRQAGLCSVGACDRHSHSRGMCNMHYTRWRTHGDPRTRLTARTVYRIEWARLDELARGDLLVQAREMPTEGSPSPTLSDGTEVDVEIAWLFGAMIGDGSVNRSDVRLCLYGNERERAATVFGRLGYDCDRTKAHGLRVKRSAKLSALFADSGLKQKTLAKRVPAMVWGWPSQLRRAFLDGYCDADGHRPADQAKHGDRTYHSASRELVEDVRALHIALGDPVSNLSTTVRRGNIVINGKTVRNAHDLHAFTVWASVGRGEGAFRTRPGLAEWLDAGDFTLASVLKVSDEGVQETYDIEVAGAHNFVADGVVVHNSGFMSGITKALRGQNPFSGRLGTTSTMPWGGFIPGLSGAFTIGNTKTRGHMGGTLAGVNVESGGSNGVHYGPPAIGSDNALFNEKYTLPQVGGQFVSGGAGGGASIDPTPIVEAAFAKAYKEIGDVPKFFGPSDQVGRNQGVARAGADGVKAKALAKLQEMFASAALGPLGAGAPFYVGEISRAAKARGLGVDGATIGVATALVESGLRMYANAKVPGSLRLPHDAVGSDHDSVGLFQQRQAGWGSLEQRMNAFASAGMFFDRLMRFNWRAMEPGAAAQRVQVSAFPGRYSGRMGQARGLVGQFGGQFDNGGLLSPGMTMAMNNTGAPERVLDNVETRNYDTLTRLMGRGGVRVDSSAYSDGGQTPIVVNVHPRELQSEEKIARAVTRELQWEGRLA